MARGACYVLTTAASAHAGADGSGADITAWASPAKHRTADAAAAAATAAANENAALASVGSAEPRVVGKIEEGEGKKNVFFSSSINLF